jgi:hypothetical protein
MKVRYVALAIFLFNLAFNSANAGFNNLTTHSRANCINNESITWDWTTYRMSGTVSQHYRNGVWIHGINTGWEYTWRSAAVHWGEAKPGSGWTVIGYHWLRENNKERMIDITEVSDCSIYDGWWDRKKK